jgi:hypothetical protein
MCVSLWGALTIIITFRLYVDTAVRHVLMRSGIIGVKVGFIILACINIVLLCLSITGHNYASTRS